MAIKRGSINHIAGPDTAFGIKLPIKAIVYDETNNIYYELTQSVIETDTLNTVTKEESGGSKDFIGLDDTPASYLTHAGQAVIVNGTEDGLEFSPGGVGDVVGPASSTDNAIARYDSTTGKIIQNSGVTIDDEGTIESPRAIKFDVDNPPTLTPEGTVMWNGAEYTIDVVTGLGATLQLGAEMVVLYKNDTGVTIPNGKVLHPVGGDVVGGEIVPTVELADASTYATCQGSLWVSTHEVLNGQIGFGTIFGKVRDVDTTSLGGGAQVWLSATSPGDFTNTQPEFPNFVISMGGTLSDSLTGQIFINQTTTAEDIVNNAWDGSFVESFNFIATSDGATITGTLENVDNTRDMTMRFTDGYTSLDTTPGATITLTAGTDTNPQTNYIYIPKDTKVLTVATGGWPDGTEHIKVAYILCPSASLIQTDGVYVNQNWNDHIKEEGDNGHLLHIAEWIRNQGASWSSGAQGVLTVGGAGTTLDISVSAGKVFQLHKQTFDAFNTATGDDLHIVNNFTTPYFRTTDLETQTSDATGTSLLNSSYSVVLWGVANKSGEEDHLMINLPTGSYGRIAPDSAVSDADNFSVYDIPTEFASTGFLIARFTFQLTAVGVWTLYDTEDLRGKKPNTTAGGGGGGGGGVTEFTALTDTPSAYTSQGGKRLAVNVGETAVEFVDESPLTTKGDVYTYDTDNARLPVGTNDYALIADSTQATGLNYKFKVNSDPTGVTGADQITNTMSLTQAEYDAITPDASTVYVITDGTAASGGGGFNLNYPHDITVGITPIIKSVNNLGATYTVPTGKVLYITSGSSASAFRIKVGGMDFHSLFFSETNDTFIDFGQAVIINEGEILSGDGALTFNGFLVDKNTNIEPIYGSTTYTVPAGKNYVILSMYRTATADPQFTIGSDTVSHPKTKLGFGIADVSMNALFSPFILGPGDTIDNAIVSHTGYLVPDTFSI